MPKKTPWDQYGDYLRVDDILGAQAPASDAAGAPAHDEMLFIQFHQIYELWFKQILFELEDITARFSADVVDDNDMQPIMTYLGRIVEIFKQMTSMIDVLETMPPQSFVDFREHLGSASGFQSLQFRLIETRLGLLRKDRHPVFHGEFDEKLADKSQRAIKEAESKPSLFQQLDSWLARTPFVKGEDYSFLESYRQAVRGMFDEKMQTAQEGLSGELLEKELAAIEKGCQKFDAIFDEQQYAKAVEEGRWRLSWRALQAALFVTIYRDEPLLQAPYNLLKHIMDVDELLARWRFRHALMVQRMVGMGMGTGGSSGYEYLMRTVSDHRIFNDIFALSTYLIPSRLLPELPENISDKLDYNYAKKA